MSDKAIRAEFLSIYDQMPEDVQTRFYWAASAVLKVPGFAEDTPPATITHWLLGEATPEAVAFNASVAAALGRDLPALTGAAS